MARNSILLVAKDVFLETGYERASMDAVAARAGTLKRSLYAHFESKDKLFLAVLELIRELEADRARAMEEARVDDALVGKIAALQSIRGIGDNFAAVLTREVFYRSFDNQPQIASYVGITPMSYQSGGMDRDRSISRAGNPRAARP